MVQVLPEGAYPLVAFAITIAGTLVVFARRDVPKAYGLALVILAVFGVQALGVGRGVEQALGLQGVRFLAGEQWWAPLTYMFLHAGILHIFGNLFILLTAGPGLEDRIGSRMFLVIYFAAGLGAAAAHVGLALLDPDIVTMRDLAVGASGAIFGVLTAYAVRYPRNQLPFLLPLGFIFRLIYLPAFVVLLIHLGMNLIYMIATGTGIAWWGHFAGFLVGLPFAYRVRDVGPHRIPDRHELPDVEALRPLATTRDLKEIHRRLEQFRNPEYAEDATFADAWLDRFFAKAHCPRCGGPLRRDGFRAACEREDYEVDFSRKREKAA